MQNEELVNLLLTTKSSINGTFAAASEDEKQIVTFLAASWALRDGVRSPDGSRGSVHITQQQLLDLITYARTLPKQQEKPMPRIIGVSGTHGAGKTTTLEELKKLGHYVDDFKVSRSVQRQLGWDSLTRVLEHPDTMFEFQNEVLRQKLEHDTALLKLDAPLIFVERTFADVYAYTALWTWKFVDYKQLSIDAALLAMLDFTKRCQDAQSIYSGVVLLDRAAHVPVVNDPHRAKGDERHYFNNVVAFTTTTPSIPVHTVTEITPEERALGIQRFTQQGTA